jgi:hypothetical protein
MRSLLVYAGTILPELVDGKVIVLYHDGTFGSYKPCSVCFIPQEFDPCDYVIMHNYNETLGYAKPKERQLAKIHMLRKKYKM